MSVNINAIVYTDLNDKILLVNVSADSLFINKY